MSKKTMHGALTAHTCNSRRALRVLKGSTSRLIGITKSEQGDRCVNVVEQIALPFSKLELVYCGVNQQFAPDVCEHDEHAIPTNRKGSFLVVGDWGWDALVHGNVPKAACQQEIGTLMTQKMDELGDVKFIINVGDSFYPDGLTSKQDPRWDKQWRDRYPEKYEVFRGTVSTAIMTPTMTLACAIQSQVLKSMETSRIYGLFTCQVTTGISNIQI